MIRPLALASALALSAGLGGCISLLPKAEPVTLYKLCAAQTASGAAPTGRVTVLRGPTQFTRAAAGDRILTTTGVEGAYIGGARWVAPIQLSFDEEMTKAFDATSGVRLAARGEAASSDLMLRVEVRTFEAHYGAGPKAAPTVVVEARAVLTSLTQKAAVGEKLFHAEQLAADNRVGPIVEAFNSATGQVLGGLASWTQTEAQVQAKAAKPKS